MTPMAAKAIHREIRRHRWLGSRDEVNARLAGDWRYRRFLARENARRVAMIEHHTKERQGTFEEFAWDEAKSPFYVHGLAKEVPSP